MSSTGSCDLCLSEGTKLKQSNQIPIGGRQLCVGRVHRLIYWPWACTLHRHATTPEHYCRVPTGAPTRLLALGMHTASPRHHARTLLPCPNGCTDYTTGPGHAHCIATPPRPNTTAVSERVRRLNYWPWARTLHRHATTPEHYCRVRTGAPPKLLALDEHGRARPPLQSGRTGHVLSRHRDQPPLQRPAGCTD